MAKLPEVKRVQLEDLPGFPKSVTNLVYVINLMLQSLVNALNKDITLKENILCQEKELTFRTSASYNGTAANFDNLKFKSTLPSMAKHLLVTQIIQDEGNHVPIENAVRADWLDINRDITIYLLTGLTASKKYTVRFLVF
tara:strand:- start:1091 stop:1510 length:420 start_codon:yes stop_codon:yes gene_type:complete